jgi:poly-beta-1,6-N-acetyl-D-glucosamine N-deacetylase
MPKSLVIALLSFVIIAVSAALPGSKSNGSAILYRDQVAVLMYHHLHRTDTSSSTITPDLFKQQLEFLKKQGYTFISLSDFKHYLDGASVPDNAVLVTFDDGYESLYKEAYPILKELQVPAVSFLITETLNDPKGQGIPFISKEEIAAMTADSNLVSFGCHTNNLHDKLPSGEGELVGRAVSKDGTQETDAQYQQRIGNDIATCIDKSANASQKPVDFFAYPFGIYSNKSSEILYDKGIRYAFTIVGDMATRQSDRLHLPRINAGSPEITPQYLNATIKEKIVAVNKK